MIFSFFTGLGPGGLNTKPPGFILSNVCIPGSSHGGIALGSTGGDALNSDQAYDQNDTVSLLGGSGGETNYLITFNSFVALI